MTTGEQILSQLDAIGVVAEVCAEGRQIVLRPTGRAPKELRKTIREHFASVAVAIEARRWVALGEAESPTLAERGWYRTAEGWRHPNLSGAFAWSLADALQLEAERMTGDARAILLLEDPCPS